MKTVRDFLDRTPRLAAIIPLAVALLTFLAFSGVLRNGFVGWDDDAYILRNYHYRTLDWENLRWMFGSPKDAYDPLVWLLFALTHAVWGMNPLGYHLMGVLVHTAVAVGLYYTTVRLLRSTALGQEKNSQTALRASAAIAALLFALHPLRVEAVAWASAQHYTLSSLFFLASLWSYLEWRGSPKTPRRWLTISVVGYALCMLSGPIGVTLPIVLLILDRHLPKPIDNGPGISVRWKNHRGKVPFFIISILGAAAAIRARTHLVPIARHGIAERVAQALFAIAFYLWKTLAPWRLSPLYPLPYKLNPLAPPFLASGAIAAAITAAVLALRRRWPAGLSVWAYYIVALAPVLGFAQVGSQIAADRYSYLSSMGFAVLAAGAMTRLWTHAGPRAWRNTIAAAGALLCALSLLTWKQAKIWHDTESLWRHALSVDPDNAMANDSMGVILAARGKTDEAIRYYDRALQAQPDYPNAHNNLGVILAGQGKTDEAIRHFKLGLKDDAEIQFDLGEIAAEQGKTDEARRRFEHAIQARPDYAEAHYGLGRISAAQGNFAGEIQELESAIRARPDYPEAQNDLGVALDEQGKKREAARHFELAIRARPDYAEAHNNLGGLWAGQGGIDEAIRQFELALQARPDYVDAHNNLGGVLAQQGKTDEAIQHFHRALQIDPGSKTAGDNLALILRKSGRNR